MFDAEISDKLRKPFPLDALRWKVNHSVLTTGSKARIICFLVPYIDSRYVMSRFDEVIGINNWKDEYIKVEGEHPGYKCRISLRLEASKEWVTKEDVAPINRSADPLKSSFTDSFKRAAVHWGVARYLYEVKQTQKVFFGQIYDEYQEGTTRATHKVYKDRTRKAFDPIYYYWASPLEKTLPDSFFPDSREAPISTHNTNKPLTQSSTRNVKTPSTSLQNKVKKKATVKHPNTMI